MNHVPVSSENATVLISTILLVLTLWQLGKLRQTSQATTAEPARWWAIFALVAFILSVVGRWDGVETSLRTSSALGYFAAVVLLTPLIAILGARRPGVRAWPWFVVLPLVVVLQWPSVSQLISGRSDVAVEVPTPTTIGFLLVLVMGAGNYFGTLNTLAAVLGGAGIVVTLARSANWVDPATNWPEPLAATLFMLAAVRIRRRFRPPVPSASQPDVHDANRLWIDFRDLFGIVWARRVVDRVNQFAQRESWDVQLTLDGFVTKSASQNAVAPLVVDVPDRAVEVLCWVLRRFVDPPFVHRYLPNFQTDQPEQTSNQFQAES